MFDQKSQSRKRGTTVFVYFTSFWKIYFTYFYLLGGIILHLCKLNKAWCGNLCICLNEQRKKLQNQASTLGFNTFLPYLYLLENVELEITTNELYKFERDIDREGSQPDL